MVTKLTDDENSMRINGLDICVMEIGLTVGINGLGVTGSNLRYERMTKKGLIVDNNGIGSTGFRMSGLRGINSSLYCNKRPQQR